MAMAVVQMLDLSLFFVYPYVTNSIRGSSGLAIRARFSTCLRSEENWRDGSDLDDRTIDCEGLHVC